MTGLCAICGSKTDQPCRGTMTGRPYPIRHDTKIYIGMKRPRRDQRFYRCLEQFHNGEMPEWKFTQKIRALAQQK